MTRRVEADEQLLARHAAGDEAAFAALLQRHWGDAYRLAQGCLRNRAEAEDVTQDAFLQIAAAPPASLREVRAFGPWLRTVLFNTLRNHQRGAQRREARELRAARRERTDGAHPDEALLQAELRELVEELPLDVRFPILLHYYEGHGHQEVAEIIGCPAGTASSRIRRGLKRLESRLTAAGYASAAPVGVLLAGLEAADVPPPPAKLLATGAAASAGLAIKLTWLAVPALLAALGLAALQPDPEAPTDRDLAAEVAGDPAPTPAREAAAPIDSQQRLQARAPSNPAPLTPDPEPAAGGANVDPQATPEAPAARLARRLHVELRHDDGAPAGSYLLYVRRPWPADAVPGQPPELVAVERSDAAGRLTFLGLEPGTYELALNQAGRALETLERRAGDQHLELVVPRMPRPAGVVVDDRGRPVAQATVQLQRLDDPSAGGVTDAEGRFELEPLAPGPAAVMVHARGYLDHMGLVDWQGQPLRFTLAPGRVLSLTLELSGDFAGHTGPLNYDLRQGGASWRSGERRLEGGRGELQFEGAPREPLLLVLAVPGSAPLRLELPDHIDALERTVQLERGHVLRGELEVPPGFEPGRSILVSARGDDFHLLRRDEATLRADGRFELRGLPAEDLVIELSVSDRRPEQPGVEASFTLTRDQVLAGDLGRVTSTPEVTDPNAIRITADVPELGLRRNDLLIGVGGQEFETEEDLSTMVMAAAAEGPIRFMVLRGEQRLEIRLELPQMNLLGDKLEPARRD